MSCSGGQEGWDAIISRSPYRVFSVDCSRIIRHWDDVSSFYDCDTVDMIDRQIWDTLCAEGIVPRSGTVLDIGCGTGALTESFAKAGAHVLGIDISSGMLSVAHERCRLLSKVRLLCQDWRSFTDGPRFDLVFSSFCPAVDDLASICKMESMSRGRCCLVSLSGPSRDRMVLELLEEIGHPGLSLDGYDPLYPFHALKEMGREPTLRRFDIRQEITVSKEDMLDHLVSCFSLYQDVTPDVRRTIEGKIRERSKSGSLTLRDERTIGVLHWTSGNASEGPW